MSFLGEIKRRKVFQVAAVYVVVAWLLIQIVATVEGPLNLPNWVDTLVILLLLVGFPVTLIMAWAYDLTPEGLVRDRDRKAIAANRGRAIEYSLGVLLVVAMGWIIYREMSPIGLELQGILPNSIAVLPFENLSPDPDNAYFAAGIHEETLNQLSKLSNLSVTSRTSVLRYADSDLSIPQIAEELNVSTIMEGSVRYADNRVRITAQLIDAATDDHLWSEVYEENFADIFSIQSAIASSIATALEAEFSLQERQSIEKTPTDSPEAYALYLKGRYFWNLRTEEAIQLALDSFELAVELDPDYARAQSGIGDVWIFRGWYSVLAPTETFPKAKAAIMEALATDETLAEAHASRAHVYLEFDYEWAAAESEYLRAIELNPGYATAHHWYGGYLSAMERHDQALSQAHEARDLEPLSLIINTWVGLRHYFARRYEMAIQEYEKALELNPNFAPGLWHLGWALEQTGQYAAAISSAERAFMLTGNPIYLASLGQAHAKAGNDERARQILNELDQLAMTRHVSAYHTAAIHVALGDVGESLRWLERAFEERSPWIGYMKVDPRLDPLRSDLRFEALLRTAQLHN